MNMMIPHVGMVTDEHGDVSDRTPVLIFNGERYKASDTLPDGRVAGEAVREATRDRSVSADERAMLDEFCRAEGY